MLKFRLITAAILIPLVLLAIFKLPETGFVVFMGIIVLLGAWEWTRIAGINKAFSKIIFMAFLLFLQVLYAFNLDIVNEYIYVLLSVAIFWWLVAIPVLWLYSSGKDILAGHVFVKSVIGLVILFPPYVALVDIRIAENMGSIYILFLLLLIWFADSAAYFSGRKWGQHKLLPKVSPGKTWEGVAGALFATVWLGYFGAQYFELPVLNFVLLSVLVTIVSIVGDLTESLFKRQMNLKDSGSLLPGHGGVMDRIDSLTSATPFYLAGILLIKVAG
ncbi:MAG: phosphatidate cytidylyltransferase [Gammaproteobacteria bacterium]|nr:phosphatidate cytidylyltransferase [Gammaproteobacteria bacterium]